MPRSLSSLYTAFPMFGVPLLLVWCFIGSLIGAMQVPGTLIAVVVLVCFLWLSVSFSWRLVFASTDGERLYLWSYRGKDAVPLEHVTQVTAISRGRNPRIEVSLEPATRLGRRIVVIPPFDLSRERFWAVYEIFAQEAKEIESDVSNDAESRVKEQREKRVLLWLWLALVAAVIAMLVIV